MPSNPVPDALWEDSRIISLIENFRKKPLSMESCRIIVRNGSRGKGFNITRRNNQISGFAAGQEIQRARDEYPEQVVLIIRKQAGDSAHGWDDQPFYAPTLVLPKGKFAFLYVTE